MAQQKKLSSSGVPQRTISPQSKGPKIWIKNTDQKYGSKTWIKNMDQKYGSKIWIKIWLNWKSICGPQRTISPTAKYGSNQIWKYGSNMDQNMAQQKKLNSSSGPQRTISPTAKVPRETWPRYVFRPSQPVGRTPPLVMQLHQGISHQLANQLTTLVIHICTKVSCVCTKWRINAIMHQTTGDATGPNHPVSGSNGNQCNH